ncbi:MAG: hypothetical protein NZO41_04260, partial [Candidatus Bipolaricaulota bacterium]|nr:hypothetical protein [Candidatus Bipolaricaulota bacterium]
SSPWARATTSRGCASSSSAGDSMRLLKAVLLLSGLFSVEALAHHDLRQTLSDILGPMAWVLYLLVPVPFLIFGLIAWRLYRAKREL